MGNKGLGSDDSHKYELITESTPDNYLDVTLDWDFWYEDEKPHLDGDESYDEKKEWRGNITLKTDKIPAEASYMGMGVMFSKKIHGCFGAPTQNV